MSSSRHSAPLCHRLLLLTALAFTSAHARERKATLEIHSPESGQIQTTVTGRGKAASVAVPERFASMTPRWLVSEAQIHWMCPDGPAVELRVQSSQGPHTTPRSVDLRPTRLHGGSTSLELYLWEVDAVKAACSRDGEVQVNSVPIQLSLQCEKGPGTQLTQTLALQVHCRPSSPSEEALTGLTGPGQSREEGGIVYLPLHRWALTGIAPSPRTLQVGQEQTVEFVSVMRGAWAPEIHTLRLVQLGARGEVTQRYPPIPLSGTTPTYEPRLTLTPRRAGVLRFALEAEYFDGSRLLSGPADLEVRTATQEAAEAARQVPAEKRMAFFTEVEKQLTALDCGPELLAWIQRQPIIAEASQLKPSNISYRFTDGMLGTVHCH